MNSIFFVLRNTYPQYTNFRVLSWTFGAATLFAVWKFFSLRNRSLSPWATLKSELELRSQQILKSPDTFLVLGIFFISCLAGKTYISSTLDKASLFYTPTIPGLSTPWNCSLLLGFVIALAYGLLRMACGRIIAAALALFVLLSPVQLYVLRAAPDRDYARAPWILAIMLGSLYLARFGNSLKRIGWNSVILGLLLGLGAWTRREITLFALPTVLILLLFTPLPQPSRWRVRISALAILVYFFFASSPRPLLDFNAQQASAGYMSSLDNSLGLSRPPYDMGYMHLDEYLDANNAFVTHSSTHSKGSKSFNQIYATTLPADFIARTYASILRTLTLPFRYPLPPTGIERKWVTSLYSLRAPVMNGLEKIAIPLAIATLFTLLSVNFKYGLIYLGWTFFLGTLFTTQFWQRHYFYGELLSWWGLAWTLQLILSKPKLPQLGKRLRFGASLTTLILMVLVGTLEILRPIQEENIRRLVSNYESVEKHLTDPARLKALAISESQHRKVAYGAYLGSEPQFRVAEFGGENCPFSTLWPVIRYLPTETGYLHRFDWSRTLRVDLDSTTSTGKLYFPTWQGFQGVELPSYQSQCLLSLKTISHPEEISVPMTVAIPLGREPLYQRLVDLASEQWLWGTRPSANAAPDSESSVTVKPVRAENVSFHNPTLKIKGNGWSFQGFAESPSDTHMLVHRDRSKSQLGSLWSADISPAQFDTDILVTNPTAQKKGHLLIVQGVLSSGGITVGLLREGEMAGTVHIISPGKFTAVFEVQKDGVHQLGIASNLSGYNVPELRFDISRADWMILPDLPLTTEIPHGKS